MRIAAAPLFTCPIYDGAADPTVLWHPHERQWFMYYTARRANVDCRGFAWVHGTPIGIASSADGHDWLFRGWCGGWEFEPGLNTFWAPEILWHEGLFHAYTSVVRGVPVKWSGDRRIVHYTSRDGFNWEFQSVLPLGTERAIDAAVYPLPSGGFRLWFKDEDHGHGHTRYADSPDLYSFEPRGVAIEDEPHEGPNVFALGGYYWMITDPWRAFGVYRSSDLEKWERRGTILGGGGVRNEDQVRGAHGDVVVVDDHAFVFYFTHPAGSAIPENSTPPLRRSVIQVARLEVEAGELICIRDEPFDYVLPDPKSNDPESIQKSR